MADQLPPVGEFAEAFQDFMRAMSEAAERPESPLVARLREHLGVEPSELPVTSATFGVAERPNLQLALEAVLPERETTGLSNPQMGPMDTGFRMLFARFGPGSRSGGAPVEYADVELGDGRVVRCVVSALMLSTFEDQPVALTVASAGDRHPMGQMQVRVEGIASDERTVSKLFSALRAAMIEHNVFRGKIISLTPRGSVSFPAVPQIDRDSVVLPEGTLERLEQHAIAVAQHADELRRVGRHLKCGVLLHGPPGTGKTLTVNYLLTATEGRTTVLLTGEALGQVSQAFAIARELAPATIVLEDVDLVAAERTMPGGHGVLFELLNQLEGLSEDSDLLVLLTTNRPDLVEPALAARPGRVDLALEFPLPDEDGRRRLLRLYAQQIDLDDETERTLVERSEGATGALIKELMRQAALRAAIKGTDATAEDVASILDELLEERAALTRRLLGQPGDGDAPPTPPAPGMLRAFSASGLPMPPHFRGGP